MLPNNLSPAAPPSTTPSTACASRYWTPGRHHTSFCHHMSFFQGWMTGLRIRTCMTTVVYDKILRLRLTSLGQVLVLSRVRGRKMMSYARCRTLGSKFREASLRTDLRCGIEVMMSSGSYGANARSARESQGPLQPQCYRFDAPSILAGNNGALGQRCDE